MRSGSRKAEGKPAENDPNRKCNFLNSMSAMRTELPYSPLALMPHLMRTCVCRRDGCFTAGSVVKRLSAAPCFGRSVS